MLKETTKLYSHQIESVFKFHIHYPKTADWSDCGVGKSLIALSKFDALYASKTAKSLLIVCPLSVMSSWRDEVKKHTNFQITTLKGPVEDRIQSLSDDSHIYLTTYGGIAGTTKTDFSKVEKWQHALYDKFSFDNMIVCDEATMIKNIDARRTQALLHLCDRIRFSMFLSGTFVPQDLSDIFTIYRLMDQGETFGDSIPNARQYYMKDIGPTYPMWVMKPETEQEFLSKLYHRAIRIKKDDCLELPDKIHEIRTCSLTPQQTKHYKEIKEQLFSTLESDTLEGDITISTKTVLSSMSKLQQIIGGFAYDKNRKAHSIPSYKYNLIGEILAQIGDDKAVIYARYREELAKIQEYLKLLGYGSALLHGGLSDHARATNIGNFRNDKRIKVLVAQISTGGYGLTVVEANHIIYFSMTFSQIDFRQSQDRIHRIGQTKTCVYHYLLTEPEGRKALVDRHVYDSLIKGIDFSKTIEDLKSLRALKKIL